MSIKAVIFDLDGTITEPFFDFDAIRQQMGLAPDAGPVLEAMEKMNARQRTEAEKILRRQEDRAVTERVVTRRATERITRLAFDFATNHERKKVF